MPIKTIINLPKSRIGLWHIRETPDELLKLVRLSEAELVSLENMTSIKRRTQWLAVRALLRKMNEPEEHEVDYNEHGKPILPNRPEQISISHSEEMVAVQLSASRYCGVDVQKWSSRMERLAPKFVNRDETAFIPPDQKLDYLNLIWTMKEAVFKHFGSALEFKRQIHIQPFDIKTSNKASAIVLHGDGRHRIALEWKRVGEYFLTYLC